MAKDMKNGETREYNGKKFKYQEIEAIESDMNWIKTCCSGCCFENNCIQEEEMFGQHNLGNCYEEHRIDKRNGIFIEVEEV